MVQNPPRVHWQQTSLLLRSGFLRAQPHRSRRPTRLLSTRPSVHPLVELHCTAKLAKLAAERKVHVQGRCSIDHLLRGHWLHAGSCLFLVGSGVHTTPRCAYGSISLPTNDTSRQHTDYDESGIIICGTGKVSIPTRHTPQLQTIFYHRLQPNCYLIELSTRPSSSNMQ